MLFAAICYFKFYVIHSYSRVRTPQEMLNVSIPFTLVAILFYVVQYYRLRFTVIDTNLARERLYEIISRTADELEWISEINSKDLFVFKTNPKWWSGSWGEQITILLDKDRIMINSICDPDKRASVISIGRNNKNVTKLIENIKTASR
jgi:hypothetical protein